MPEIKIQTETQIQEYFSYMFLIPIMENNETVIQSLQTDRTKQTQTQKQEKYTKVLNALGTILYDETLHAPETVLQNVQPFFTVELITKIQKYYTGVTQKEPDNSSILMIRYLSNNVSIQAQCVLLSLIINGESTKPAIYNLQLLTTLLTMIGNERRVRFPEGTTGGETAAEGATKEVSRASTSSNFKSKPITKEVLSPNNPLPREVIRELTERVTKIPQTTSPKTTPPPKTEHTPQRVSGGAISRLYNLSGRPKTRKQIAKRRQSLSKKSSKQRQ
jgi:hypothetical protein